MEKELTRETVDPRYTWDLTRIYASDEAWEEAFADVKAQAEAFGKRAGTLTNAEIDAFYRRFAPMLNFVQRKKLEQIVTQLKNI